MAGDFEKQVLNAREKFNSIKNKKDDENNLYDDRDNELEKLHGEVNKISAYLVSVGFKEHNTLTKDIKTSLELLLNEIKEEIPKLSSEQIKKMRTISSIEFLTLPESERLEYVTSPNKKSSDINENDNITFNFTFEGKKNNNLYMLTTAGQILPREVRKVMKEGVEYERNSLKGEFYNGDKRLIINDKTDISIIKIGTEKELEIIDAENQIKYDNFILENKDFEGEKFSNTIKEAINKGITDFDQIKFLLTGNTKFLDKFKIEELEKIFTVSMYLKNAGFLDNAGVDTKDLISDLKEIIKVLKTYGKGLKYNIVDGNIKFDLKNGLPEQIEGEGVGKFIKVALSQLGTNEFDGGADKYLSKYGKGLNSRNTPWCAAFINWSLEHSGYKGTGGLSSKQFIGESGYGHVGIKVGDKILGGNQGNRVSLNILNINKVEGYVMPDTGKIFKKGFDNIPNGAIVVYGRHVKDKRYS